MHLQNLKTFDEVLKQKQTYIVSLGSIEQHGEYGPLGTDYFIQDRLIRVAEKLLPQVIFLPVTPFGPCWQQLGFSGSISLQESTLFAMISDIVDSLKECAHTILFVSWHGGNKPVISKFLEDKSKYYPEIFMEQITFGDVGTDILAEKLLNGPVDDHAGNTEVALMLAIDPSITLQPKKTDRKNPNNTFDWDRHIQESQPDGIIDPHTHWVATPELGEQLINIYSENLANKIKNILSEQ